MKRPFPKKIISRIITVIRKTHDPECVKDAIWKWSISLLFNRSKF